MKTLALKEDKEDKSCDMYLQSASTFQQAFPPALISIDQETGGSSTQVLEITNKCEPSISFAWDRKRYCQDRKAQLEAKLQSH